MSSKIKPFKKPNTQELEDLNKLAELKFQRDVILGHGDRYINTEKLLECCAEEVQLLYESTIKNAVRKGEILTIVKKNTKKGVFCRWVTKILKIPYRTAHNLMIVYRVTLDYPNLSSLKLSVIYILGTREFSNDFLTLLSESGIGIYDINRKDVIKLKTAIHNGQVDINNIKLDNFFKRKTEINIEGIIQSLDDRIIKQLKSNISELKTFQNHQKNVAGIHFKNIFTNHSQFLIEILETTIAKIIKGPNGLSTDEIPRPFPNASDAIPPKVILGTENNAVSDFNNNSVTEQIDNIEVEEDYGEIPVLGNENVPDDYRSGADYIPDEDEINYKGDEHIPDEELIKPYEPCHDECRLLSYADVDIDEEKLKKQLVDKLTPEDLRKSNDRIEINDIKE